VTPAADVVLQIDRDHVEEALINLVRNAADAALSRTRSEGCAAHVDISWQPLCGGRYPILDMDRA